MPQSVTANRLTDGRVVFRTAEGGWSERIETAVVAGDQSAADDLLAEAEADARRALVVGPYLIDVTAEAPLRALRLREAIRADGPSVPLIVAAEGL